MDYLWDADRYQHQHAFVYRYGSDLISWLQPQPGENILDLGCGTGELTDQIRQSGAIVIGIDRSAEMIQRAQEQYPGVTFYVRDATRLKGLPRFDAIFSNAALHWIRDAEALIHEMHRHLRPGGRLVAELGGRGNVKALIAALNEQRVRYGYPAIAVSKQWFFPSLGAYRRLLIKGGFRVQQAHCFPRDTPLSSTDHGIVDWIRMFGKMWLADMPEGDQGPFLQSVQEALYPRQYRDGVWYADYQRLRVVAVKE